MKYLIYALNILLYFCSPIAPTYLATRIRETLQKERANLNHKLERVIVGAVEPVKTIYFRDSSCPDDNKRDTMASILPQWQRLPSPRLKTFKPTIPAKQAAFQRIEVMAKTDTMLANLTVSGQEFLY